MNLMDTSFLLTENLPGCAAFLFDYVTPAVNRLFDQPLSCLFHNDVRNDLSKALFYRLYGACFGICKSLSASETALLCPASVFDPSLITDDIRAAASDRVLQKLHAPEKEAFPFDYRLLIKKLSEISDSFFFSVNEMLERIAKHKTEIEKYLLSGKIFSVITSLPQTDADTHNGGRVTTVIVTDAGKFVYKPHDLRGDVCFSALLAEFLPDTAKVPACITENSHYGFSEFVEHTPLSDIKNAARYYYRTGKLFALFTALGTGDLHESNLTACGDYPVPIDLEVLFQAGPAVQKYSRTAFTEGTAYSYFSHSIALSGPFQNRPDGIHDISPLFDPSGRNLFSPRIDKKRITADAYEKEFTNGFTEAYRTILYHRDSLINRLSSFSGISFRVLFNNTAFYAGILNKLSEPSSFISEAARKQTVYRLLKLGKDTPEAIRDAEAEALLHQDIPVCYIESDNRDLYINGQMISKNFYAESGLSNAKNRIRAMNEAELAFEKSIIHNAFLFTGANNSQSDPQSGLEAPKPEITKERLLSEAEALYQKILTLSVAAPSGDLCLTGITESNQYGIFPDSACDGSAGIALFASALYSVTDNRAIKDDIRAFSEHCLAPHIEILKKIVVSGIPLTRIYAVGLTGISGTLLSLMLCGKYLGQADYIEEAKRLTEYLNRTFHPEDITNTDLYQGLAGLIHVLCRFPELHGEALVSDAAARLSELRTLPVNGGLWPTIVKERPISGAGHGMAGIGAALWEASDFVGNAVFKDTARIAFEFENNIYSPKLSSWPDLRKSIFSEKSMHGLCSGAPGIGLIVLPVKDKCASAGEMYEKALRACLSHPLARKDHLCCGNAAVLEFLLSADIYESHRLKHESAKLISEMLTRKQKQHDFTYGPDWRPPVFNPSLFWGAAGIGYELLRFAFPDWIEAII